MARVVWTFEALDDLEAAIDYIGQSSTAYARMLAARAFELTDLLAMFPELGRMMPEFGNERIRELIMHSYRIVYHVEVREVRVVAFLHGARDISQIAEDRGWTR